MGGLCKAQGLSIAGDQLFQPKSMFSSPAKMALSLHGSCQCHLEMSVRLSLPTEEPDSGSPSAERAILARKVVSHGVLEDI